MRPRFLLRPSFFAATLLLAACSSPPSIPAPWDAVEPQAAEPPTKPARINPTWARLGASVRGKALLASTTGDGPRHIYIIGGIHGDEPEAPGAAEALAHLLLDADLTHSTVRLVKDMNPDGGAANTRTNTRRVDLERNWPSKDFRRDDRSGDRPLSELETAAVHADLTAFKPDIVIVFQSANLPPSISFQGPGRVLAHQFATAARGADPRWRFNPGARARVPGSIESLIGDKGGIVLRVEFQRNTPAAVNARAVLAGIIALDQKNPSEAGEARPSASSTPVR